MFPVSAGTPENERAGWKGGFDVVLGNPPWERVQFEERAFFSASAPQISKETNQSRRRALIAGLESSSPTLFAKWAAENRQIASATELIRRSGAFPFSAIDKFNTYALFTELSLTLGNLGGDGGTDYQGGFDYRQNMFISF